MAGTAVQANNVAVKYRGRPEREMPLKKGSSPETVSSNIEELHTGNTFAHTAAKFGKARANKQAIAIALNQARKSKRKVKSRKGKRYVRQAMGRGLISEKVAKARGLA